MLIQPILNIAEICARKNLRHVILSPGSRVAHLAIAFVRHPEIQTFTLSDERSAAFTSLGMANVFVSQYLKNENEEDVLNLVAIACTSGSAAYNYAPAVAEAFYQQIPLLVLTADRPQEWIDQQDGQAIRQNEIFGKHVKASYQFPSDFVHADSVWMAERIINEAINLAQTFPFGPVHINIPIREPFYPTQEETVKYDKNLKIIEQLKTEKIVPKTKWQEILSTWEKYERKLIVVGQDYLQPQLLKHLQNLVSDFHIPIVGDLISNTHTLKQSIRFQDIFLMNSDQNFLEDLQPDLFITFGKSLVSKNLKNFLRKYKPQEHWHIQTDGQVADTFQTLTHHIPVSPIYFFEQLFSDLDFQNLLENPEDAEDSDYFNAWQKADFEAQKHLFSFFEKNEIKEQYSEMLIAGKIIEALPENCCLHLANSMSVRYANFWSVAQEKNIEIFANRGTSGIDGSLSTAVGSAIIEKEKLHILLIGDMSFFYDRNGLWNNELPTNIRIILLNNQSGNIFRMIDGPSQQPELEKYFETYQNLNAINTAKDFDLIYFSAKDFEELNKNLDGFFEQSDKSKLLEIFTDKQLNTKIFKEFKQFVLGK